MDILMVGWEFPPFYTGGLGIHCYHLTKNLSDLGAKLTFLMPKNKYHPECDYMKIVEVDSSFIPGPYASLQKVGENYDGNLFDNIWKYNQLCLAYALQEKFDLIHCHDWMTAIAGIAIKKKTGKPLVVTMHSTEYDRTGALSPNPWIVDRERNIVQAADIIIAVSEAMKRQLIERYNADAGKIVVIYNAIDHANWAVEQVKGRFPDERIVLFLGRLTIQKGPDFFIRAARKVLDKRDDVTFVIGGRGDMLPQLIRQTIEMGISDKVMFLGYVPDDELPRLYSAADVFVLSSVSEPFGITVLEAIASGTPTIITKQSGVREVVRNAFSVDFWDVDEMANKMLGLLAYPSLHTSMKENGLQEISGYTWDKVAAQTLEKAYRKALDL